ncbi:MAG TPA: alkaline phosphatase family protein [Candidatus Cybelea sp.]|nr:alkaline phosphatase family protein [Candidatus Cybelea sp.]
MRARSHLGVVAILSITALAMSGCAGASHPPLFANPALLGKHHTTGSSPIQHIVIIVQENRSFDNLFATFPGARGATTGQWKTKSGDKTQTLSAGDLYLPDDITHCNAAFKIAYDGGKMDGFNQERIGVCALRGLGNNKLAGAYPYQYVNPSLIAPYWDIAKQWVLADAMFQTQGSGSFTAHQDLIRGGTAIDGTASDPNGTQSLIDNPSQMPWGCDSPPGSKTKLITIAGKYLTNGPFPCSNKFPSYPSGDYETLRDLLDGAGISWKYYSPCFVGSPKGCCHKACGGESGAVLNAFDVIYPVRYGSEWGTNVSMPETNIFNDVTNGALPGVSWVIPEDKNSDHPGHQAHRIDAGPQWVASVVNAVGESTYWDSTAIIVVWDDWGGLYDNAVPPFQDKYGGLGFRVPMLVLSPYARPGSTVQGGYVSHTQYEFGSILKYIEQNFGLGSLGTTDERATSIGDIFNYEQSPRQFQPIPSKLDAKYFQAHSGKPQHGDPE